MSVKRIRTAAVCAAAAAALALSACVSGMVLGGRATCTGSTVLLTQVTGECERSVETLDETETQSIGVQTSDVQPFATVDYVVIVRTGRVNVTFVDSQGVERATEAAPGSPASGSVRVQLDPLSQIKFTLEPIGGPASDVSYELSFVCDCMP